MQQIKVAGAWKTVGQTYIKVGGVWKPVGPEVETVKNFQTFLASGTTTVPDWSTKMYYLIVRGGNNGSGQTGGSGGQVLQGNTAVIGGTSLTITVGGAGSNSSVAISGGATFTASTTGAAAGVNGTQPTAPFNIGFIGGGGGNSITVATGWVDQNTTLQQGYPGGFGGGGSGRSTFVNAFSNSMGATGPSAGAINSGGGGGAPNASGGSGIVMLYFS